MQLCAYSLVAIIPYITQQEHVMSTTHQAKLVRRAAHSEASIHILAPAHRVWQLLADIDRWSAWNPAVQAARLYGDLATGSVFKWKSKGFSVTSTLQEVQPAARLRWTGRAFGTTADHSWTIERTQNGVWVRTAESFDGWLPRLLKGSMQKTLDDTLPAWLATLKAQAERGC
jgi:uncharacterized protein YndB with AHSA1/START domain